MEAETEQKKQEQPIERELIEKGVKAQWVKTQAIQEYELHIEMEKNQDSIKMSEQQRERLQSIHPAQRWNEQAVSVCKAVASTPVGDSTLGTLARDQGSEYIMRETTLRLHYITGVQYDHPFASAPKEAFKETTFQELPSDIKAHFEESETRTKKSLLPEKPSLIRTHRIDKAFLEALDSVQDENKIKQSPSENSINFFPDEKNPKGGSNS